MQNDDNIISTDGVPVKSFAEKCGLYQNGLPHTGGSRSIQSLHKHTLQRLVEKFLIGAIGEIEIVLVTIILKVRLYFGQLD